MEQIFRSSKTVNLEMRPVHVRSGLGTRAHVMVVMLSSLIIRHLRRAWTDLDLTVEEGLKELSQLCATKVRHAGFADVIRIPKPRATSAKLLSALNIQIPEILP
ncbi:MAG: hypothetical protein PHV34_18505 [Verrucomicrobiae bacterium]|nr:hypothetical protein [Verrucomicrobiae bacterium]